LTAQHKKSQLAMMEQSAEEAAHAHARAVVTGDIGAFVRRITPDVLAKAMEIGGTSWDVSSYELRPQGRDGDDYIFTVSYQTSLGPLTLRERFRNVDGDWKMVDIERIA
jgi:hypothetical protein